MNELVPALLRFMWLCGCRRRAEEEKVRMALAGGEWGGAAEVSVCAKNGV